MTSHPRRSTGPVRQHSLQQLPRRHHHQMRRQKSAEEDRSLQIRTTDPIRARRDSERSAGIERPKVRFAWGEDATRISRNEETDSRVEVVACQIGTGKSRPLPNPRQPRISARNNVNDKTLLYSRQELAERLRLAWKQREANKSNIDVFLAHGTSEQERSDSRLSSSSSVDPSPVRLSNKSERINVVRTTETRNQRNDQDYCRDAKKNLSNDQRSATNSSGTNFGPTENSPSTTNLAESAKSKRASFKSCTNSAFHQPVNEPIGSLVSPTEIPSTTKKDNPQIVGNATSDQKNRRTNSAPTQRRANSVGPTSRTQVSIVIEAPSISKPEHETADNATISTETNDGSKMAVIGGRPIKSAPTKRRARSGKRRANSVGGKDIDGGRAKVGSSEPKNAEVVTMVSLISDADSDSEIEDNSPRDDKLISQLRSNLPTQPIIKTNVTSSGTLNSIARRPIKSVSFQQDSIDLEEPEVRTLRIRPQSVQVGRVTGSALPTPEEARTWRTEVTSLTITSNYIAGRQNNEEQEITDICLTDREKRCLIVPIGDPRSDKKRKLLRTRSTPPPPKLDGEKQSTMHQTDCREISMRTRISGNIESVISAHQQSSVSKLVENVMPRTESEQEIDDESVEPPAFHTTKEKECWHLYRRMCDKGVCVSFDTVLRGMLTPTEYRLRRKEMT